MADDQLKEINIKYCTYNPYHNILQLYNVSAQV